MTRTSLIAAVALIAVASTAVIATAHDRGGRGEGPREGRGPAMLFERFDTDNDGSITKAEVEAAVAARFAEADANGDGQLSAEELAAAAEARRMERQAERQAARIDRMIERMDENGDGTLSLEEMAAMPEARMFDRLDADEDGVITQAEVEDMRGQRDGRRIGRGHGHDGDGRGYDRWMHRYGDN